MRIILLRHGIAEEKGASKADEQRHLTAEGHRKMKRVAKWLAKTLPEADSIFSSPLVRAYETAEWLVKAYGDALTIQTTDALKPGSDPDELRGLLDRVQPSCAYFAGHEPHLTAAMLALTQMKREGTLELKKGGCYGLELEDASSVARLRFMLEPSLLR